MKLRKEQFKKPKGRPYEKSMMNFSFMDTFERTPDWTCNGSNRAFDNSSDWWDEDKELEVTGSVPGDYE